MTFLLFIFVCSSLMTSVFSQIRQNNETTAAPEQATETTPGLTETTPVDGQTTEQPNKRYIVERDFKPPIFGSYNFDLVKGTFLMPNETTEKMSSSPVHTTTTTASTNSSRYMIRNGNFNKKNKYQAFKRRRFYVEK